MNEWLLLQEGMMLYIALFALLLSGAIGLPMPEDIPLVLAGVLIQAGRVQLLPALLVCYLGIVIGDVLIFGVGWRIGPALFQQRWFRSRFSAQKIKKVRFKLERRSLLTIFIARHLFYIRTLTFLTCGAVRMNFSRFLWADLLAAMISAPIMVSLGYAAAWHYEAIFETISEIKYITLALGALAAAGWYMYWKQKKANEAKAAAREQAETEIIISGPYSEWSTDHKDPKDHADDRRGPYLH